jgi:molecular chaperone GrpE
MSDKEENNPALDVVESSESAGAEQTQPETGADEGIVSNDGGADKLSLLETLSKENYDKYLRAVAELENFKRRAQKERSDLLKYNGENLARDLLEVLDNLERAIIASESSSGEEFVSGVKMICEQFLQIFDRHGIRSETALGGQFDPAKHEALASVPTEEKEPNSVIDEYRKAYFFKDRLLRPGQVVVAVKPQQE